MILGVVRPLMGRRILHRVLRDGMPAGSATVPESVPPAGEDGSAAVERLKAAIAGFKAHTGEYLPSPLFGKLTREEANQVQLRHDAHHLSFLVPRS